MSTTSCRVIIEWDVDICRNLSQHRNSYSTTKKRLISIISSLLREGYHHFIVDIDFPADYWLVELIYATSLAKKNENILYTIGLWSEEDMPVYDWLEYETLSNTILLSAYRIYYRKEGWHERNYELKIYKVPLRY